MRPKFASVLLYDLPFLRYMYTCTRTAKTLNSQKYSIYTKYLPLGPKFWSISLYDLPFPRYNMLKVGKIGNAPNDPTLNLNT